MTRRPLTPEDTATIRRMAQAGYSDGEIAQHLGRDRCVVGKKRREMGLRPGLPAALVAMMARLHARRYRLTAGCTR